MRFFSAAFMVISAVSGWILVANAADAQARWRPLDLVTAPSRPNPIEDAGRIQALIRTVSDTGLSYAERAVAARALACASNPRGIRALADAIVEPRRTKEGDLLRVACAEALAWPASKGNRVATEALYSALLAEDTYARAGAATAKALLDSRGAEEVTGFFRKQLLHHAEAPGARRSGSALQERSLYACWIWTAQTMGACHISPGTSYFALLHEQTCELATALQRKGSRQLGALLSSKEPAQLVGVWVIAPRGGVLLKTVLGGLGNRSREAREAIAEWVLAGGGCMFPETFWGKLNEDCIRQLWQVKARLPAKSRNGITNLLTAVCHGDPEALITRKRTLREIVLEKVRSSEGPGTEAATGHEAEAAETVEGLRLNPWIQLSLLPVHLDPPEKHPCVPILVDTTRPIQERLMAASILSTSISNGGIARPDRLLAVLDGILKGNKRTDDRLEPNLFHAVASLLLISSPPEQRPAAFREALRLRDQHPLDQALFIGLNAGWAYQWMDAEGPIVVAKEAVSCLDRALNRRDENLLRIGSALQLALQHLTPEKLPPFKPLHANDTSWEEGWNAETLAAWRAWLKRFRKLPVFRDARRAAAALRRAQDGGTVLVEGAAAE